MPSILIILLAICKLDLLSCEIAERPKHLLSNSIRIDDTNGIRTPFGLKSAAATATATATTINDENDYIANQNDLLNDPISSISIDYLNNALILKFHRGFQKNEFIDEMDTKRQSPLLDKNFMRFGRGNDRSRMRFGKRQIENEKDQNTISSDRSEYRTSRSDGSGVSRDARGDNFMRFGRVNGNNNLMRFGRAGSNGMMRFGRTPFSSSSSSLSNQNLMRFGRSNQQNTAGFMRFGRPSASAQNLMRFGRSDIFNNKHERNSGFIRFGRGNNLMRFGRNDNNFMRFGKLDQNFMRFGKRNHLNDEIDELNKYINLKIMNLNDNNDNKNFNGTKLSALVKLDTNDNGYKLNSLSDNNNNNNINNNQQLQQQQQQDLIGFENDDDDDDNIMLSEQQQKQPQLLLNDDLYSSSIEIR